MNKYQRSKIEFKHIMEKSKKEKRAKSLLQSKKSDYSKTKEDMEEKRKKERMKDKCKYQNIHKKGKG